MTGTEAQAIRDLADELGVADDPTNFDYFARLWTLSDEIDDLRRRLDEAEESRYLLIEEARKQPRPLSYIVMSRATGMTATRIKVAVKRRADARR